MKLLPYEFNDFQAMIAADRLTPEYRLEGAILAVTEALYIRMEDLGLSRREFALRMGVSPARITNIFKGRSNFTLGTLVEAAHALDCDLSVTLVPHRTDATGENPAPEQNLAGATVAAESPAQYGRLPRATRADRSRDDEIRAHLASGKLRVEGDRVLMRHERDGQYYPATFRRSSAHSAMEKTNVGERAYYRERILAVAREAARSG